MREARSSQVEGIQYAVRVGLYGKILLKGGIELTSLASDLAIDPWTQSSSLLLLLVSPSLSFSRCSHPYFNDMAGKSQIERAIKEIQGRRPAPDIDFTQHQLENGFTVSTQERVVKEVFSPYP